MYFHCEGAAAGASEEATKRESLEVMLRSWEWDPHILAILFQVEIMLLYSLP